MKKALPALGEVLMKRFFPALAAAALLFCLCTLSGAAQEPQPQLQPDAKSGKSDKSDSLPWYNPKKYNPAKLIKRTPRSANEQLADDGDLENKLTQQLQIQGLLGKEVNLQDACSAFKELVECLASLRVSNSLKIDYSCLKWDVTGVKPKPVADSCAGPAGGKAMGLYRSIDLLKPDANAREESKNALRRAHENIKDAS